MKGKVTIVGLQQALAKLRLLPLMMVRGAEAGRSRATARIAASAERLAPRLTGDLAGSIAGEADAVIATADHARFQEMGTAHNDPQPFFGPALELERGAVVDDVGTSTRAQVMRLI